jgi:hypothetical protein
LKENCDRPDLHRTPVITESHKARIRFLLSVDDVLSVDFIARRLNLSRALTAKAIREIKKESSAKQAQV